MYLPAAKGLSGRVAWCHQHPCYTSPEPQWTEVTSTEGAMQGRPSGSLFCKPSPDPHPVPTFLGKDAHPEGDTVFPRAPNPGTTQEPR